MTQFERTIISENLLFGRALFSDPFHINYLTHQIDEHLQFRTARVDNNMRAYAYMLLKCGGM